MKKSTENMSEDLMFEILSRLPVKSLIRFRCVSKFFYALVKNPRFIAKHTKNFNDEDIHLIVAYTDIDGVTQYALFLDETLSALSYQKLDSHIPEETQLVGPYQGFFFLYDKENDHINAWNLATRESQVLPSYSSALPQNASICYSNVGFGLDLKTNDHKLILIRTLWDDEEHMFFVFSHVLLYTLSTNSWKEFEADELKHYFLLVRSSDSTYMDGVCHWLSSRDDDDSRVILSFRFDNEVFQEINGPSIPYSTRGALGMRNNSLALLLIDTSDCFDIWEMIETQWTKALTIGPLLLVREPLGFWKNGGFFVESNTGQLLLYDLNTQEFRDLGLKTQGIQVHIYKESLLTIKRESG